ncbi:helix-turn-helix transcriptional regulator [Maribacter polysiphoniae]|uniref:AraC-like DNA-binding protein n=1 Tax=Maribacter polysiphoniae TaxID=429344 RepID=A0A316E4P6_9FLAO|nr:AraC family transcriptional regulator [Maribacter polysiphoniae]MBD1260517.1 helix-turn-helix transcriptional regulator [Maribacter polysiphoniae]PWK24359.1 AraC-like DNA-binding protein [Maribacter polysiphoniae]
MKSTLKSSSFTEKTIVRNYPKGFKSEELREETVVSSSSLVKGETKEIFLDGIKISIRKGKINPPLIIDVEHNFPFFKMHFEIEGNSHYTPKNDRSVAVKIPNGHYNFFFLPMVKGKLRYDCYKRNTLEILFTKDYLKRVFGHSYRAVSSSFGDALERDIPFLMWKHSKPITSQLQFIIDEIINCTYEGAIKKAYLESKITEILTLFFDSLKNKKTYQEKNITEDDYLNILKAETIIKKNLKNPPTILELSQITGINQFKLKQNFKLVFGMPIFSYLTELRMVKAKKLILEKGYTVTEASYEIGYKNPQHFTTAFKRKYNYLPSKLKKH